jgi:hypothetical protein
MTWAVLVPEGCIYSDLWARPAGSFKAGFGTEPEDELGRPRDPGVASGYCTPAGRLLNMRIALRSLRDAVMAPLAIRT